MSKGAFSRYWRPCHCQDKVVSPSNKALTLSRLGVSRRNVTLCLPQVSVNGLQVIKKLNFIYIPSAFVSHTTMEGRDPRSLRPWVSGSWAID